MKQTLAVSAIIIAMLLTNSNQLQAKVLHLGLAGSAYTTLDAAINAAVAGDTIYVYPGNWQSTSNNGYGLISKKLTFISYGSNYGTTGLQNITAANFIYLQLASGSANSSFQGVDGLNIATTKDAVGNITINRCDITLGGTGAAIYNNWTITQSTLNLVNYLKNTSTAGSFTNFDVENCIIETLRLESSTSSTSNGIFKNNVFTSDINGSTGGFDFASNPFKMVNNIFYFDNNTATNRFRNASQLEFRNNVVNKSIIIPAGVPLANNNKVITGTIFVTNNTTQDGRLQLDNTGPAYTAADDGRQCGIFGGSYPYKLNNIPPVPAIYQLKAPSGTVTGTTYTLTLSVRSNN